MTDVLYHIKSLEYSYPLQPGGGSRNCAISIPDLIIEKGVVTAIRGHNGSGKTTLLKILAGLLKPQRGEFIICGAQKVILVQQEPYLFHSSVYQNLVSPLRFSKVKAENEETLVHEKLKLLGLEGFEKRKARGLSGGEMKRVAIARALMASPDVLLLDEPDGNIDNKTSTELENLILSLKEEGLSIILCSHHKGFAYRTSDVLIDLYQGSPAPHDENIFKGEYIYQDGLYSTFRTGEYSFRCSSQEGVFNTLVIPPESIILSRESFEKQKSNRLKGTLLSMDSYKQGLYTLTLDCGIILKTRTSSTVLAMLNLSPGDDVNLLFSPSSLRLY